MCEELTGYDPISGSYVTSDDYTLVSEGDEFKVYYARPAVGGNPKLSSASFALIRSFDVSGEEIKLKNALIEGKFSVRLNPNEPLRPTGFIGYDGMPDLETRNKLLLGDKFELADLHDLPLPTVIIRGKFKHLGSGRCYDVKIKKALVTQDFPGSFFAQPLEEAEHTFIATHADFSWEPRC